MNSIQYSNGDNILEPQANCEYAFENDVSLLKHVIEHVIALHDRERWDNLEIIPRNDFHRVLKDDSIQQAVNKCVTPAPIVKNHSTEKYNAASRFQKKQYRNSAASLLTNDEECEEKRVIEVKLNAYDNKKEIDILKNNAQFIELSNSYQRTLVSLLCQTGYNVYPHYHILKSKHSDKGERFKQIIKLLDSDSGVIVVAIAPYLIDSEFGIKFKYGDKYVIVSGYRFWRSKTKEERERKFHRMQKELNAMELNHDREFQKVRDVQMHLPEKDPSFI